MAPALAEDAQLSYERVTRPDDEPLPKRGVVDVAVLDMHHGYANLGHQSIVETLLNLARDEREALGKNAPGFRVISYDVRAGLAVPNGSASRFALIVGTGGPGALDPRENDGASPGSQGVLENPSWEGPLFRFFDRVLADRRTYLLGVCHSFGVLSRWSGVAESVYRIPKKGAKSVGVVTNVLTAAAKHHPWFSGLYRVRNGPLVKVLDSRLYDLIATGRGEANVLAYEEGPREGTLGDALTMVEFARAEDGVAPRIWGVNCHPEIGDRGQQRERLDRLAELGEVSPEWVEERRRALEAWNESAATERGLQWTSQWTFEGPLRRVIAKTLAERRRPISLS